MFKLKYGLLAMCLAAHASGQTYINYADGKPVMKPKSNKAQALTDGSLTTGMLWINPKGKTVPVEVDLTAEFDVGGVHLYLDTAGRLPLREFSLQSKQGGKWVDIPGTHIKDNFKGRVAIPFDQPVSTSAIRLNARNEGGCGILEMQVWGKDVPAIPHGVETKAPKPFTTQEHWVCVNQVAYNLGAPKGFTVPTAKTDLPYSIREKDAGQVVFKGVTLLTCVFREWLY